MYFVEEFRFSIYTEIHWEEKAKKKKEFFKHKNNKLTLNVKRCTGVVVVGRITNDELYSINFYLINFCFQKVN